MSGLMPRRTLPDLKSQALLNEHQQYVSRAITMSFPFFAARGNGALLEDVDGNCFIDFAGGFGAMNVGHGRPEIARAISEQAAKFTHTCFAAVMYEPYVTLAKRLTELVPGSFPKKAALFNSGAEAVENAVKIACYATGRPAILVFEQAFHGRTLMTMTMTGKVHPYKEHFGPYAPEFYRAPYPYAYQMNMTPEAASAYCLKKIEHLFDREISAKQVAAIIVEPVQGEGGFIVPPPGFLRALKELCERYGILLIADEVQTGFCRTGRMFAIEHEGIEADLVVVAKSLAAGLPISGVIGRIELLDALPAGTLGSTYGGNPVACAAALAALNIYEQENLAARAHEIGQVLLQWFQRLQERFSCIGDVRGLGAMVGMEIVRDPVTREPDGQRVGEILAVAYQRGLILIRAGIYDQVIRVLVPLNVTDQQLMQGLDILSDAFNAVVG